MATAIRTIELENIGPIHRLSIPVPEGGGLVVLRGRNGRGKSRALDAVDAAIAGRGKVEVRDGQRSGRLDGLGVSMKVGRSTRRSGELEVETLDGKLDVSKLVDPGLKSPEAADATRVKALIQLSDVPADPAMFYQVVGGKDEFERLVGTAAIGSDDLVLMAERIKRDIEAEARAEESRAVHAEGRARGAREAAGDIDPDGPEPPSADALQVALEAAIREETQAKQQSRSAEEARRRHQTAQDALEDAEANYTGPSMDDAAAAVVEAGAAVEDCRAEIATLEAQLAAARAAFKQAEANRAAAVKARDQAAQHANMVSTWRETLRAPLPERISPERLAWVTQNVQAARQAVEQGVLARKARQHLEECRIANKEAAQHRRRAAELRDAARGTDDVLSSVVARTGWPGRVEAGRLVLDTSRGPTFYAELSHGERWRIGLDVAIDAVGAGGLLKIDQEAYESLDPINRAEIAEHLRGKGVVVLTAEASDGEELTAEVMQ